MLSPFDIWSPTFHAPFSGDVTQEITPRVFSPDIKGSMGIENRIQTQVASYGTQLGKILEALMVLADKDKTALPEIEKLIADIEAVKADAKEVLREEAIAALARLEKVDPEAHADLVNLR
ncbi:hypothetical protein [Cognatiyoonia sp. IB215182]|uniref:hypothetical protein n=1 Tax=Cognatiyoonia sp. IB215182 TaxID=3097353 RepID=UPI002A15C974|nr:hypothetical protein [Cognatiyoonia sp. IB215182]MDX8351127.1 hypothetical protein [Cognatiyoonia sp. IB215182]